MRVRRIFSLSSSYTSRICTYPYHMYVHVLIETHYKASFLLLTKLRIININHYEYIKNHQSNHSLRNTTHNGTVQQQIQFYNNNRISEEDTQDLPSTLNGCPRNNGLLDILLRSLSKLTRSPINFP